MSTCISCPEDEFGAHVASMADSAVLFSLAVLVVFSEGQTTEIQTQQTVVAAVGQNASLKCQLIGAQSTDIHQVSWGKILPDDIKKLAASHKEHGTQVNPDFQDKMEFRYDELQTFMLIRKVTEQDEGCYRCLFNRVTGGSLTGRTCLQVYELHPPVLHVQQSNSAGESVVSCSATGRPAPNVTLDVTQQHLHFSHYNTVSVNNNNGTVTVTTTAVLSGFRGNSTQVGCAARVLSAPQMEAFVMIPDGFYNKLVSDKSENNATWIIALAVVMVLCCCVAVIIFALMKQKSKIRDPEKNKTPQKTTQDIQEITTPLINQENEHFRQRTSTKKSPPNSNLKPSPLAAKRLFEDSETC